MKKTVVAISLILGGLMFANISYALTITPPRFEIAVNPGQRFEYTVQLYNETDQEMTVYSSASNFTYQEGQEGVPKFYDLAEGEEGLAKWIEVEPGPIVIAPQERKDIKFAVNVPQNADPGGHYAGLFFGSQSSSQAGSSGVGVSEKIGALILMRVSGDIKESGRLVEFNLKNSQTVYDHLPVNFALLFENSGNIHLKPAGEIVITDFTGRTADKVGVNQDQIGGGKNVLPNTSRHFEAVWTKGPLNVSDRGFWGKLAAEKDNFALGRYKATLNLEYGSQGVKEKASVVFWVFPWHLLLVLLIVFIIALAILFLVIRSYNRWIIGKALGKDQKN